MLWTKIFYIYPSVFVIQYHSFDTEQDFLHLIWFLTRVIIQYSVRMVIMARRVKNRIISDSNSSDSKVEFVWVMLTFHCQRDRVNFSMQDDGWYPPNPTCFQSLILNYIDNRNGMQRESVNSSSYFFFFNCEVVDSIVKRTS